MTRQWIRQVNLQVGNGGDVIDLSNMRIRFNVQQGDVQTPNHADIIITNLSEQTANRIQKEYDSVVLQAGYDGNCATIFQGEIVQKRIGRENPTDTYLYLIAKEGQKAYSYAMISKTLAAGHTFRDQVDACLKELEKYGITAGYIVDLGKAKMPRGKALFGMVKNQLRAICAATGTSWSIQGKQLQIVRNDTYIPGNAIVLNSDTGMVGMPVQTMNGIEVRCLLNPQIKPGRRLKIDQASIQQAAFTTNYQDAQNFLIPPTAADGIYKVLIVNNSGDTRGNPYYTDAVCVSASSSFIPMGTAARGVPVNPQDK
ncbi:phage protein [Roseixanthobacter glucoisosaccharinicivorans]|uniref:phage protein n=1 Tax=Roseixanthobacter glucoisosaccharinicivorans TaxID=3119923 RepID=UPI003728AFC3